MRLTFRHGASHVAADLHLDGEGTRVVVAGREYGVAASYLDDGTLLLDVDGTRHLVRLARRGRERFVAVAGEVHHFVPEAHDAGHEVAAVVDPEIRSPMPGKVQQVLVAVGSRVETGDGLLIIEAMKMENRLTAPAAGVVDEVRVEAAQMVDGGQVLVVLRYD